MLGRVEVQIGKDVNGARPIPRGAAAFRNCVLSLEVVLRSRAAARAIGTWIRRLDRVRATP